MLFFCLLMRVHKVSGGTILVSKMSGSFEANLIFIFVQTKLGTSCKDIISSELAITRVEGRRVNVLVVFELRRKGLLGS